MSKGQYSGVSAVAQKIRKEHVGVSGAARKVTKGFVGVSGVARQFFAAVPTWKKYKTNVAYTLGVDETVNADAEKWSGFHISREYGPWPYFQCIVSGKGNPASFVSMNQSTGKIKWTNSGGFRQDSDSSGGWSPRIREQGSASDQEYNSVVFFHNYGETGSPKYNPQHYTVTGAYMHDEDTTKTCCINLAWASVSPDTEMDELWATVLYYTTPKLTLYHFYPKASYSRGDYIEEVTSESEGTYPANGRHTDGYWYVRQ